MNDIDQDDCTAVRWRLAGRVQGVGFRPFVYRLAHRHRLLGWVQNQLGHVEILGQGRPADLDAFALDLIDAAPPLARPQILQMRPAPMEPLTDFSIRVSTRTEEAHIHVPPDYFTCNDCLAELADPSDRRYRYPFINCTQCGPRYTLIVRLPYDRSNTAMTGFPLCDRCRAEYENPLDRRFHAEPIACPACGPRLEYRDAGGRITSNTQEALAAGVSALKQGRIIAVKGVGGYHLMCDARNAVAVHHLRERKPRPHKPLAVMFPVRGEDGLESLREAASPGAVEAALLRDPMRPIVLVAKRERSSLDSGIAPGLGELGAMLPYTPLHQLLLEDFGAPLVATSANLSGEPVLTEEADVESRLARVADGRIHHDRPILRPADDPLFRVIRGRARPLRLGRGCAPLELRLPLPLPHPVLASGAHMKNTIALGWEDRVVVSPHIGDMGTLRSLQVFEQIVVDLQALYGVEVRSLACDAHPGYATTRWAERSGLPLTRIFHHHAHASALAGDHPLPGPWLVFTWDGVGYGEDGTLWGGEALYGVPGAWRRVASMRPFRLPGGDKAGREPWRSAAGLCWEADAPWPACPEDTSLLRQAWRKGLNAPVTTAVGRLFDAAASLTGVLHRASFEGQGPMLLEAACAGAAAGLPLGLSLAEGGHWETDWAPLLSYLQDGSLPVGKRAAELHASMAEALLTQALKLREELAVERVGLCGGVFQNRVLVERAVDRLESHGFVVHLPEQVPVNDAGISFGQIVEYAAVAGHH